MIHQIHNKEEAWRLLCATYDCGGPMPTFDLDAGLDPSEIPVNLYVCPTCGRYIGDTLEDLELHCFAINCKRCGSLLDCLLTVELVIQGMKIHFRGDA